MTDQPETPIDRPNPESTNADSHSNSSQSTNSLSVKQLYRDIVDSLVEPRWFYQERFPKLSFNYAVAMGLIVGWLAETLQWLTRMINNETLLDGFIRVRDQLMQLPVWKDLPTSIWAQNRPMESVIPAWLAEASTVALFPFSYLIKLAITATALTLGGWLFISNRATKSVDRVEITAFLKLAAVASTPALIGAVLSFLPLNMGAVVGWLYLTVMLWIAISVRYQVSMLRAFAVWLTPWMVMIMAGACIIGVFGAMIVAFLAAIFGGA